MSSDDPRYKPSLPGEYRHGERRLSQREALPDPELKPDVPAYAEKMNILEHVRTQEHPLFLNAAGGPDINGPREVIGLEIRCPVCKKVHKLGPPGAELQCPKCHLFYKYTVARANCWLWIWRAPPKLSLDPPVPVAPIPCKNCVTPITCTAEKECALEQPR
jgi:hypothetical protein